MIAYKILRRVALALRWVQGHAEYNAETFAAWSKIKANDSLDKSEQRVADKFHDLCNKRDDLEIRIACLQAQVEDELEFYTDLVDYNKDIRHDINIEVI